MDFSFTPEQDEAAGLAAQILGDRATNDRQKTVEATGSRFDADLWRELGDAGLVSLALLLGKTASLFLLGLLNAKSAL